MLALGTFLMGTTEFVVAGLLPETAGDVQVSVARAGLLITVFAIGMIVGAPLMAMLTLRLPQRLTLILALGVFAAGHVVVALGSSFALLLAARFVTALATGAFWAVANVVATRGVGPAVSSRALGVVGAGAMLANVVGVPLGAFAGQLVGWRGPFWALAGFGPPHTTAADSARQGTRLPSRSVIAVAGGWGAPWAGRRTATPAAGAAAVSPVHGHPRAAVMANPLSRTPACG
ncbi:MFS transporter [Streptomyces sp. NPDC058307]|uniref:MFS transporter n=1 Tax=Streptomyces sp. NPDC058307 TaxID=3346439 RepID=UPI0036EF8779